MQPAAPRIPPAPPGERPVSKAPPSPISSRPAVSSSALSSKTSAALSSGSAPVSTLTDEVYVSYARSKHGWLYDIYKVGGMTLEEFRNRVKAKMEEDEGGGPAAPGTPGAGPNAAFANLNKEINKKFKK